MYYNVIRYDDDDDEYELSLLKHSVIADWCWYKVFRHESRIRTAMSVIIGGG